MRASITKTRLSINKSTTRKEAFDGARTIQRQVSSTFRDLPVDVIAALIYSRARGKSFARRFLDDFRADGEDYVSDHEDETGGDEDAEEDENSEQDEDDANAFEPDGIDDFDGENGAFVVFLS